MSDMLSSQEPHEPAVLPPEANAKQSIVPVSHVKAMLPLVVVESTSSCSQTYPLVTPKPTPVDEYLLGMLMPFAEHM